MKKKGFTLVELLGVIVVLAIIALIAVPTIIGVIDKSRKGALRNSGHGLVEAGTLYYAEKQNTKTVRFDIQDNEVTSEEENKLTYKGNIKEGTILINNKGEVTVCINDGKYAAYKNFKDNKVIVVDNKTCTIPENSNIVYLDNEATINIDINDLVTEIENLKQKVEEQSEKIEELKLEKSNQIDVANSIYNLTNTHSSDMASLNNRLDNLISNLENVVRNTMFHSVNDSKALVTKTSFTNTGVSVTIAANSYYCVTASILWNYSAPKLIGLSDNPNTFSFISENGTIENSHMLSTTKCGKTTNALTLYAYASSYSEASNTVRISGFYIET